MLAELLRTTRILNVDDDESGRYVTTRLLRSAGFEVFEAASGEEALTITESEIPDLVVLDVNLPGLNGFEVCRRLKTDPRTEHVPIIHLTATARDAESAVTGLDAGADAYLSQPVERTVLLATVRAILRARRAETQLAQAAHHWRLTFDTIGDPICVIDAGGVILRANLSFATLAGHPVETIAGMNATEALPHLWPNPPTAPSPEQDLICIGSRWFRRIGYPITDAAGTSWAVPHVVILTEVTEQKRADEERSWLLERERSARAAAEQARSDLWFLALASEMLAESLDQETILHTLVTMLMPRLGDACAVFTRDGESIAKAASGGRLDASSIPSSSVEAVIESARARTELTVDTDGNERHEVIVPLAARGDVLGALWLARSTGGPYDDSVMALVADCARRAALAIDNARLYEERKRVAAMLQQGLLPADLPAIPGVELAARFRSGSLEALIGGDFYDVFSIGDGRWSAVIGDVQGRGVRAASLTALARHTVKTAARVVGDPTAIVRLLNEAVASDGAASHDAPFLSTVYAEIEPHEGGFTMRVVCAGHPLPLLIHTDGSVDFAGRPGTVVGPFDEPALEEATFEVKSGETVIFYTDGVTEARAGGELYGEERLMDLASRLRTADLETLVTEVEHASIRFASGDGHDDIAILALRAE